MTELAHIIRHRRRELGWSLAQLASAAGCSKAYLSAIENARLAHPPSRRVLEDIERALEVTPGNLVRLGEWQATPPGVRREFEALAEQVQALTRRADGTLDLDALLQNVGSAPRTNPQDSPNATGDALSPQSPAGPRSGPYGLRPPPANIAPLNEVNYRVPLINNVAAGYPADFTDLEYPARIADEYVHCPGLADSGAFAARVVGESMMPEYREGDVIVFSPEREPSDGCDCFVRLLPDHQTTFKRVFFEEGERVRLQPLNPAYPVQTVPLEEVSGIWPAVYRLQRLGM